MCLQKTASTAQSSLSAAARMVDAFTLAAAIALDQAAEKRDLAALATHPMRTGEKAAIFRLALFGRPFIEGAATVIGPVPGIADFYRVRFDGEPLIRERYVFPEFQQSPERMLAILQESWAAAMHPEILEEFFPKDLRLFPAGEE